MRPFMPPPSSGSGIVPGQYIVTLSPRVRASDLNRFGVRASLDGQTSSNRLRVDLADISTTIEDELESRGRHVSGSFRHTVIGFSAELTEAEHTDLESFRGFEVVPDQYLSLHFESAMQTAAALPAELAPLGLDRIDQRFGFNGGFSARRNGTGVHVYVIDSGIRPFHDQFRTVGGTRVRYEIGRGGYSAVPGCPTTGDFLGHGTHVAGIIGGKTKGVAPEVTLHSVRVFGEERTTQASWVIGAVDWVTGEHAKVPGQRSVANLSLGAQGGTMDIHADHPDGLTKLNKAIYDSIRSGVIYVISAGNDGGSACEVSPAKVPEAITVGAIDPTDDRRPDWSNQGGCVDIFAPGVQIWSASHLSDSGTINMDGTSMAAPHVAGVAALVLEANYPISVRGVWDKISDAATTRKQYPKWRICNIAGTTPNTLLHWGSGSENGVDDDPLIISRLVPCGGSRAQ
jgi:serine protease